ncbi:MFS transporter [Sulfurimonas sp. HSL3-7]|uniref:MFS transporter n=1 Tax=Sulfonitrofixus jiaomeiensis TaxID=3131938 RepID=UPI0031F96BBF
MTALIALFYFFYFAIVAIYVIFLPKVLSMVGYTPSEIGIIFAAGPLVRFAIPFLFLRGVKLDLTTFNGALLLLLIAGLSFFVTLESFWPLLFSNIAMGIGMSLILPYIEVIALSLIGKESYGKVRLFGSIGFILVALVLVKFLDVPATALLYLLAMIVSTVLVGYLIAHLDNKKELQPESIQGKHLNLFAHWPLWLGLMLMQVSFGPFYNFFTIYATEHGVSLDTTIYLWSFGVIAEIILFYFQGPLLRRNLLKLLEFALLITIIRWLLTAFFPDNLILLFFAQSLHAFSFALFHTAAISYLYELYSERKLAQQFFFGISYGMGGFIGAVTAGYIYELWPTALFLYAAAVAAAALLSIRFGAKFPAD